MPYSLLTKQLLVDLWRYGVVGKSYLIVLLQTANAICTDCYSAIFTYRRNIASEQSYLSAK